MAQGMQGYLEDKEYVRTKDNTSPAASKDLGAQPKVETDVERDKRELNEVVMAKPEDRPAIIERHRKEATERRTKKGK